jgi:hypothetical protein
MRGGHSLEDAAQGDWRRSDMNSRRTGEMVKSWKLERVRGPHQPPRWTVFPWGSRDGATPPDDTGDVLRGNKLALTSHRVSFSFPPPSYNLPRCRSASPREVSPGIETSLCLIRTVVCPLFGFLPVGSDGSPSLPSLAVRPRPIPRLPFLPLPFPPPLVLLPFLCRAVQTLARGVSS